MDDKLTAKTAKFTSLENLYEYGIHGATHCMYMHAYIIRVLLAAGMGSAIVKEWVV